MSGPRQLCYQADVDVNPETAVPPRSASGVSASSPYRPAPEPRQRGPVCVECRHSATRGHRFHGDARLVCLADGPVVVSAGRFDHVSGRIIDRVEADPPLCRDLNGDGQCERFEVDTRLLPLAHDPTQPSGRDGGTIGSGCRDCHAGEVPARWPLAAVIVLSVSVILYGIGFVAVELMHERAEDSQESGESRERA